MTSTDYSNTERGGGGGGGSHLPASPSFLVRNEDNVNSQIYWAQGLITMWDFKEHQGRIGTTNIVLSNKAEPSKLLIMQAKNKSRYFPEGRLHMSSKIRKRLGRFEKVPGLMATLTYDPKKTGKREAWALYGPDTRRFLNAVNQYRRRKGQQRLQYLWVVEVQEGTGYPHVHIFLPGLGWIAPLNIINGNWTKGRANITSPKSINVNCAGYISKYLRKMQGWKDIHLALMWSGHCRMYGFSRGFTAKGVIHQEPQWEMWHVVRGDGGQLRKSLEEGGYTVEHGGEHATETLHTGA
jgi:hypothetical protein